jgi:predicted 2-oxoglutarate/Fe(II)-dependent dioxygenase YbiX
MSWQYDYWYQKDFYNKKQIKDLTSFIEKNYDNVQQKSRTPKDEAGKFKKNTNTLAITWEKVKHLTGHLEASVNAYNENNFGYTLFPFNNLMKLLLNIYDSKQKGEYGWHYDCARSDLKDFKLSILVNLSEKYEGGELQFFQGNQYTVKDFTPGTLLLFKSYINHRVTPVTKGVRKTLALFCSGPKFR